MSEQNYSTTDQLPPEQRHQSDGVNISGILWSGLGLTVVVIVAMSLMAWLFLPPNGSVEGTRERTTALPDPNSVRLDPNQPATLMALRQREANRIGSYGWIDTEQKFASIPIDRAITLYLANPQEQFTPADDSSVMEAPETQSDVAETPEKEPPTPATVEPDRANTESPDTESPDTESPDTESPDLEPPDLTASQEDVTNEVTEDVDVPESDAGKQDNPQDSSAKPQPPEPDVSAEGTS